MCVCVCVCVCVWVYLLAYIISSTVCNWFVTNEMFSKHWIDKKWMKYHLIELHEFFKADIQWKGKTPVRFFAPFFQDLLLSCYESITSCWKYDSWMKPFLTITRFLPYLFSWGSDYVDCWQASDVRFVERCPYRERQVLQKPKRLWEKSDVQSFSYEVLFTQPLRSGRIWHKVNF